jgi:hypothetical protein
MHVICNRVNVKGARFGDGGEDGIGEKLGKIHAL